MVGCTWLRTGWGLQHQHPELFVCSQWDRGKKPSFLYTLYKLVGAVLVTLVVLASIIYRGQARWFAYMTNQGGVLLSVFSVLEAILVIRAYRGYKTDGSMSPIYRLCWGVQNITFSVATVISIMYWATVHPFLETQGIFLSWSQMLVLAVPGHTLNFLACFIDSLISARPTRLQHFYLSLCYGLTYVVTSLTFWASGGRGLCSIVCVTDTRKLNTTSPSFLIPDTVDTVVDRTCEQTQPCDVVVCDTFLYPVMDWSCHPVIAVIVIFLVMVALPLIQGFWCLIYKLRLMVWTRVRDGSSQETCEEIVDPGVIRGSL